MELFNAYIPLLFSNPAQKYTGRHQITRLSAVESCNMGGHRLTCGNHAVLLYTIAEVECKFQYELKH